MAIILIIHLSFSACGVHRLGKFTMTLNYHNNHKTNRLVAPISIPKKTHTLTIIHMSNARCADQVYALAFSLIFAIVNGASVTKANNFSARIQLSQSDVSRSVVLS